MFASIANDLFFEQNLKDFYPDMCILFFQNVFILPGFSVELNLHVFACINPLMEW